MIEQVVTVKNDITQYIVFNCSPNLGLLDNWLPIIYTLQKKLPNVKFVFFTPIPNVIEQIDLESNLVEIANDIFDITVFKSQSGVWLSANNFNEAKIINSKYKFTITKFLKRVFTKIKIYFAISIIEKMQRMLSNILYKKNIYELNYLTNKELVVLFDITEIEKKYNDELLKVTLKNYKFSICHAVNINGMRSTANSHFKKKYINNSIAYIFSKQEKQFYQNKYLLNDNSIHLYGIPRHEKNWINFLLSKEKDKKPDFNDDYIFIISRPTGATVSRDKKIESIIDIKKLSEKYNLKLVIKLHPKELKDNTFEEVLGKENYSKTWVYSNKHSFVLGKSCKFAICFYSGVPVDMIMIGVPTIERLDLSEVSQYNEKNSLRDKFGNPVTEFRYLGLVLGASNYEQMQKHVNDIINSREEVIARLKNKYLENFAYTEGINDIISDEIYNALNEKVDK